MQKVLITLFAILSLLPAHALAQEDIQTYSRAHVEAIETTTEDDTITRIFTLKLTSGTEKGKTITISHPIDPEIDKKYVKIGDTIVVTRLADALLEEGVEQTYRYYIVDPYRIPSILYILAAFFILVILIGKRQGLASGIGLLITIGIITLIIVPLIMHGMSPLKALIIGSLIIIFTSIYTSHGWKPRTHIAVISTCVTYGITFLIGALFINATQLFGLGSETAFFLQADLPLGFDFRGMLLGGMLLGTLGVLDDITTAQSATIEEIHKANKNLSSKELYKRGLSVGNEHIASLVNTLVLAYAGASFPIFLYFAINEFQPIWVTLNSELFAEEIIRTLAGSAALILAVPITTYLAAKHFGKK